MKLLQGALAGVLLREDFPVVVDDVEQQTDSDGMYTDELTAVTRSGIRIRVIFVIEEEDECLDS